MLLKKSHPCAGWDKTLVQIRLDNGQQKQEVAEQMGVHNAFRLESVPVTCGQQGPY